MEKEETRKKKLPARNPYQTSGEQDIDDAASQNRNDNRKRINKFENSQYFIMPLDSDGNEQYVNTNQVENDHNHEDTKFLPKKK